MSCETKVKAQGVVSATMHSTLTGSTDSIRGNGTTSAYLYVAPTLSYRCASFQAVVTRISTAMGGSITLQGGNDGTNYYTFTGLGSDTIKPVTISDAASQISAIIVNQNNGLPYKYWRLKCTGSSSDTITVRSSFTGR